MNITELKNIILKPTSPIKTKIKKTRTTKTTKKNNNILIKLEKTICQIHDCFMNFGVF